MDIKFKDYLISRPAYLVGEAPPNNYDVCKKIEDGSNCVFVIATFWWNPKEPQWEFRSIGTRYLENYTEGLNEWLLKVMEMFECSLEEEF